MNTWVIRNRKQELIKSKVGNTTIPEKSYIITTSVSATTLGAAAGARTATAAAADGATTSTASGRAPSSKSDPPSPQPGT